MTDPIKDAAKQMDDWADRQKAEGFTGSVRMMGQTISPAGKAVTPMFERQIGLQQETAPNVDAILQRWLTAKIEFESASRDLEYAARLKFKRGY